MFLIKITGESWSHSHALATCRSSPLLYAPFLPPLSPGSKLQNFSNILANLNQIKQPPMSHSSRSLPRPLL